MTDARDLLLEQIMAEAAANGLTDRSLRDLAESVGSSHRMLLYHFGSRDGLIRAIVDQVEVAQRDALVEMATEAESPEELIRQLWAQVSSPALRPFVRLFFECVAITGGAGLTDPWLDVGADAAALIDTGADPDLLRLGVAVTRGLLVDVLATDDAEPATRSLERFIDMWTTAAANGEA